jgi:hypothetical protein
MPIVQGEDLHLEGESFPTADTSFVPSFLYASGVPKLRLAFGDEAVGLAGTRGYSDGIKREGNITLYPSPLRLDVNLFSW